MEKACPFSGRNLRRKRAAARWRSAGLIGTGGRTVVDSSVALKAANPSRIVSLAPIAVTIMVICTFRSAVRISRMDSIMQ
ncbi:hypothetical protein GCM10007242_20080 [Pigmentiphaga litoralis]|nr:hypothetical protein GCM10007242_20080 [Pigmentiphaga litoralis]